jgi:hypothetical protein
VAIVTFDAMGGLTPCIEVNAGWPTEEEIYARDVRLINKRDNITRPCRRPDPCLFTVVPLCNSVTPASNDAFNREFSESLWFPDIILGRSTGMGVLQFDDDL